MDQRSLLLTKAAVWLLCLLPLVRLIYRGMAGRLTANPIEFITLSTGTWTLALLIATLAVTPLRRITRLHWLVKFRRLLGLFAFFYGVLHLITYVWLDKFFDVQDMIRDVAKRPFITAGLTAFLLMVPLAATSHSAAIRLLGGKRWQALHRIVYISGIAGVVHFWWKVKADTRQPEVYAAVLGMLLLFRAWIWLSPRPRSQSSIVNRQFLKWVWEQMKT